MRHTCLVLLLTMPAVGISSSAALAADKNPFQIRVQEPLLLVSQDAGATEQTEASQESSGRLNSPNSPRIIDRSAREVNIDDVRARGSVRQAPLPPGRLLGESVYGDDRLARVVDNELVIPPLIAPTTDQSQIGNSTLPRDSGSEVLHDITPLPEGPHRGPNWSLTAYLWQAPNTFSDPLYFEDVMLERHGHERFPHHLQPLASGARFFATIPALPYLMTVRSPRDCYYHLGYFRVGSCAPPLLQRPPYERRAAIVGGTVFASGIVSGALAAP